MIIYVDTSTLLTSIIDEQGSDRAEVIWTSADALASVILVVVEARAALAAAEPQAGLTASEHSAARSRLEALVDELHLVEVTSDLIDDAARLAEVEGLRGSDAVHLAAALLIHATVLTSADTALCEAAARQGLHIANPLDP